MSSNDMHDFYLMGGVGGVGESKQNDILPRTTSKGFVTGNIPDTLGSGALGEVDEGFEQGSTSVGFDHGEVSIAHPVSEEAGGSATDRILSTQKPLGSAGRACRLLTSLPLLPYTLMNSVVVRKGEIALCQYLDGSVRMIGPGFHVLDVMYATTKKFKEAQNLIRLGPLHIIRILPGSIGLGSTNGKPVMLLTGRHVINDPLFTFTGTEELTKCHINNGTIHIITVPADKVALCTVQGVGHILGPGRHFINNPLFKFEKFAVARDEYICSRSKHRITVPTGRIGLGREKGVPTILEAGQTIYVDSSMFQYVGSVPLASELITHGSIKIVMVKEGKLGISFDDGVLDVLGPGRHIIKKATHTFSGFLTSGQQTLSIGEVSLMSSDNVGLTFDAAITVQVVDGKKAVTMLAGGVHFEQERFEAAVKLKGKLALSIIVGNNRLQSAVGSATHKPPPSYSEIPDAKSEHHAHTIREDVIPATSFKQHVHDQFMKKFARDMREECGVRVVDMAIEDIKIINQELAAAMSRGAVTATELDMAKIERDILTMKAKTAQQAEIIRANGNASAITIMADAEAERICKLDNALSKVSDATRQRELVRTAGDALNKANATVLLAPNVEGIGRILGPNGIGAAVPGGVYPNSKDM